MSNALAIASVTACLRDLLNNGLIDQSTVTALGQPVKVTAMAPDRITLDNGAAEPTQLNIFLYHVAPNAAWRNARLPSRDVTGARLTNPPLALDLYYLITAYGNQDFQAEILLGYAMQLLHENPVLTRGAVRTALAGQDIVSSGILPGPLVNSDLAEQVELIKLIPQLLTIEEMYRLWTALNAHYRPTAAYMASVVLIEAKQPAASPLPVLSSSLTVQGGLITPFPVLTSATPQNKQSAVRLGESLTLNGLNLTGPTLLARFNNRRLTQPIDVPIPASANTDALTVTIPNVPATWPAGEYTVAVVIRTPNKADQITSAVPLTLAPQIIGAPLTVAHDAATSTAVVTVNLTPQVQAIQPASMLIGDQEVVAPARTAPADSLTFTVTSAVVGTYLLRVRVDGVESLLVDASKTPPVFDPTQRLTIT